MQNHFSQCRIQILATFYYIHWIIAKMCNIRMKMIYFQLNFPHLVFFSLQGIALARYKFKIQVCNIELE